ncbi:MAG: hypothetical protein IJD43_07610 [Thermoguttaceae bacterium]|nr:hypothetical protein [Thermoguttaceae bacterium]
MYRLNWKWGETSPICARVSAETDVHAGDLLWLDSDGMAKPASEFPKSTDLAGTQAAFSLKFLGIAMQSSPLGKESAIRTATTGTFEFDDETQDGVQEILGTYVGANLNAAQTHLQRSSVVAVSSAKCAFGRIVHLENVPVGKVFAAIVSTVIRGGVPGSDPHHAV